MFSLRSACIFTLCIFAFIFGTSAFFHYQQEKYEVSMSRGINIGNALEAPKDIPWDVTMDVGFFDEIAGAGFDTVRLPVRFSDYVGEAPYYTLDPVFMAEMDGYIDHALELGLVLVLDCHHFEELMDAPTQYEPMFHAIWTQLSQRYQHYPKELVFELLNEPHNGLTPAIWSHMVATALDTIRTTNPTRKVIVDAPLWGNHQGLYQLQLPSDSHVIVSFHYYDPMEFTFQGDQYHPDFSHLSNVRWIGSETEIDAITQAFQGVADWAEERNVDVFLGEFGANELTPTPDRIRWTQAVVQIAESMDFGWCYWEFGSQFGIYDIPAGQWNRQLLDVMISDG